MIEYDGEKFLDPFEEFRLEKARKIAEVHIRFAAESVARITGAIAEIFAIQSTPMFPKKGGIVPSLSFEESGPIDPIAFDELEKQIVIHTEPAKLIDTESEEARNTIKVIHEMGRKRTDHRPID